MSSQEKKPKSGLFATIGSFGSALLVGFCPICIPAIGALLTAIGLGFLVNETVLKPLLIVFILVAWFGYIWSYLKEHHKVSPLIVGFFAGISLYVGRYVYLGGMLNAVLMYGGVLGIIGASVWNLILRRRAKNCPACVSGGKNL